jgi:uncharacterized protein (DUF1015 family)
MIVIMLVFSPLGGRVGMVKIAPFKGVVYNSGELEREGAKLVTLPYDVISPEMREAYLDSHPHNFLHLDLGRVFPDDPDPMAWHRRSAEILSHWLSQGLLVRRDQPSIILMDTEWAHPLTGRKMTRHGLICLLRLMEGSKSSRVRLHEKTFSYHKEERLDLMERTRAQLSPVFGFFPDPDNLALKAMYDMAGSYPDFSVKESARLVHHGSFIQDSGAIERLQDLLAPFPVYIADGHHRFETAVKYRQLVLEELERNGQRPAPNSAIDHVMFYLSPMGDPGLCVMPTHRVLSCVSLTDDEILRSLSRYCDMKDFPFNGEDVQARTNLAHKLLDDNKKGLTVFGMFLKGYRRYYFLKVKEKVKESIALAHPGEADLNGLDVSILTSLIIKKALGVTEADLDNPDCISYFHSIDQAVEAVNLKDHRVAFIMNPATLDEIVKITEGEGLMPRKATYFYPKVTNGLVFNLVDPMESIVDLDKS